MAGEFSKRGCGVHKNFNSPRGGSGSRGGNRGRRGGRGGMSPRGGGGFSSRGRDFGKGRVFFLQGSKTVESLSVSTS